MNKTTVDNIYGLLEKWASGANDAINNSKWPPYTFALSDWSPKSRVELMAVTSSSPRAMDEVEEQQIALTTEIKFCRVRYARYTDPTRARTPHTHT